MHAVSLLWRLEPLSASLIPRPAALSPNRALSHANAKAGLEMRIVLVLFISCAFAIRDAILHPDLAFKPLLGPFPLCPAAAARHPPLRSAASPATALTPLLPLSSNQNDFIAPIPHRQFLKFMATPETQKRSYLSPFTCRAAPGRQEPNADFLPRYFWKRAVHCFLTLAHSLARSGVVERDSGGVDGPRSGGRAGKEWEGEEKEAPAARK